MRAEHYVWIPCAVSPGMFESEYAAEINLASGQRVSFFVDRALIQVAGPEATEGQLRVTLVPSDSPSNERTVLLPIEAFENGSRWARVPAEQVRGAAA